MFDDVHLSVMLATLLIFLAMIVILNSILYKPLLKFMDDRKDSIQKDEQRVQENFEEISNFNAQLDEIHQNTRAEVASIKHAAINEAKLKAEEELNKKKQELEVKMNEFYAELAKDKESFEKDLSAFLPQWQEALKKNLKSI